MKLRYYLRGLGIGIVITALLMGFTKGGAKETLSDDEIIARAEALGMVQSSVLSSDLNHEEQGEDGVTVSYNTALDEPDIAALPDSAGADQTGDAADVVDTAGSDKTDDVANTGETSNTTDTKTASASKDSTKASDTDAADNSTKAADTTDKVKNDTTVTDDADNSGTTGATTITVTINSGDGSDTVARRLTELGVITDAGDFDRYLCQNGYDKKLATGNHEINAGAGYQEIAEILIKRTK